MGDPKAINRCRAWVSAAASIGWIGGRNAWHGQRPLRPPPHADLRRWSTWRRLQRRPGQRGRWERPKTSPVTLELHTHSKTTGAGALAMPSPTTGRSIRCRLRARIASGTPIRSQGISVPAGKNDVRDAADLAHLLRINRLPDAWMSPPATREL